MKPKDIIAEYLRTALVDDGVINNVPQTVMAEGLLHALETRGFVVVPANPTVEMLKPFAVVLCHHQGIDDPDRPQPPHGEYPLWYERCGPMQNAFDEMLTAAKGGSK